MGYMENLLGRYVFHVSDCAVTDFSSSKYVSEWLTQEEKNYIESLAIDAEIESLRKKTLSSGYWKKAVLEGPK